MASTCQIGCYILLELLLLLATAAGQGAPDPCLPGNHKELDDRTRSTGYILEGNTKPTCDLDIQEGWYRFTSRAGGQLPTTCQEKNKCGTIVPLWMNGNHPSVADGVVFRQVCGNFHSGDSCCDAPFNIRVKNCNQFYVYYLIQTQTCPAAYCAGSLASCPAGKWSPTGFPPCKDAFPIIKNPPVLQGPIIHDKMFDFQCEFTYDKNDPDQRFEIVWTFDGETDAAVPPVVLSDPARFARLDGARLRGHLDSNVECQVRSFFVQNTGVKSEYLRSNSYYAGIQISPAELVVSEKDFSKMVHVKSTVPVICSDGRQSCCLTFRIDVDTQQMSVANRCFYMMCTDHWDMTTKSASIQVPVVANQDLIRDGNKRVLMTFEKLVPAAGGPYLDAFALHKVDQLPVIVQDQDTSSCHITGDPHIKGFDYQTYHLYKLGDFTAYKVDHRHFEIQIRTWACAGPVTCNCGIAIREKNDLIRIDMCDQVYGGGRASPVVSTVRELSEGTVIQRSRDGQQIAVYLPSGVEVKVETHGKRIDVYITGPGTDNGQARGICGTNDGRKDNEFTHPDGTVDRICADGVSNCMPNSFFDSWRATKQTSLFRNVPDIVADSEEVAYCGCNDKQQVVNCTPEGNIKSPKNLCRNCMNIKPLVGNVRPNRRKREVVYEDTDTVDVSYEEKEAEVAETFIDVDLGKQWPNDQGMTEAEARELCSNAMKKSQLNSACGNMNGMTGSHMADCMSDILYSGTTDFLDSITSAFTSECQLTLAKDPANYITNTEGEQVMKPEYMDDICDMACDEHGSCGPNGTCICDDGWEGVNCHMETGKGPQLEKIRSGPLCDKAERPCKRIFMDVTNIDLADELICRVQPVDENGQVSGKVKDTEGIFVSTYKLACDIPEIDVFSQRFMISASNDGAIFSNQMPLHVFDSTCVDCNEDGCTQKTSASCTKNASPSMAFFSAYVLIFLGLLLQLVKSA